jgi:hypothetical protein
VFAPQEGEMQKWKYCLLKFVENVQDDLCYESYEHYEFVPDGKGFIQEPVELIPRIPLPSWIMIISG